MEIAGLTLSIKVNIRLGHLFRLGHLARLGHLFRLGHLVRFKKRLTLRPTNLTLDINLYKLKLV